MAPRTRPHQDALDTLAVTPHPLETERQRVADEDASIREFVSDDWDAPEAETWPRRLWAWVRGWGR